MKAILASELSGSDRRIRMSHRWPWGILAGSVGMLVGAAAMLYTDLPEGPSLLPLFALLAGVSASAELFAGAALPTLEAKRVIIRRRRSR